MLAWGQSYPSPSFKGIQFPTAQTYSGVSSASNSWLWLNVGLSGTLSGLGFGYNSPFTINISSDSVDTQTNGANIITGLVVKDTVTTNSTGGRQGLAGWVNITGIPSQPPTSGYVGGSFTASASANLTGTGSGYTGYSGALFGIAPTAAASSGATYLAEVTGAEYDIAVSTGASAANKYGLTIVQTNADSQQGVYDDAGIEFNNQGSAATKWKNGIMFGGYASIYPFSSSSTLINAQGRTQGGTSPAVANNGVDFSAVTFSGCAFKSTGFCVDPSGNASVNTITATGQTVGSTLLQAAIPFIRPPSGSMANNGVLTLTQALPYTYQFGYFYMPAGAIATSSTAGWYWGTCSSGTACTIYNNTYSSGQPAYVSSPTAFSTTGPGAYTQTATAIAGPSYTLAANAMGANGSLEAQFMVAQFSSANTKIAAPSFGGATYGYGSFTTGQLIQGQFLTLTNRGVATTQYATTGTYGDFSASGGAPTITNVNTANSQTWQINMTAVAAEYLVIEKYSLRVFPHN